MVVDKLRTPPDDPVLVERFRNGDAGAFEQIVALHRRTVYLVALRFLGNHEDADEAAQSTLVRAWRARERFRGDARVSTWLTRIVLNVAKSMRSGAPPPESLDDAAELRDPRAPADAQVNVGQQRATVRRAVARLPPRQREVVLLKVFSEMTYKEVARTMQLSEGSVKAHLHQAVANLRRIMSIGAESGGDFE